MADEVAGRVYVDVIPRIDKFEPALKSGVKAGLRGVESDVKTTTDKVGTSFTKAGQTAGNAFKGTGAKAKAELSTVEKSARSAGTAFQPISKGVKKAEDDVKTSTTRIGKYVGDTGRDVRNNFSKIAAGAVVGTAVFSFFKDSIKAASDLNETASKTATVFGDASGEVFAFAKTAATSLGQSTQQAEEAVATYGNLLEGFKIAPKLAADMSIQLDKLASDFASFHNANPADVIESLTAAFRGEFDPVQKFVPTINAATVQMEAMKETGKKNASALTLQEKALATYNILLKGAGPAVGDFARTSSGAANQGRILAAQFENLKASVGAHLLPAFTLVLRTLNASGPVFSNVGHVLGTVGHDVVVVGEGVAHAFQAIGIHKPELIGIATALGTMYVSLKLVALGGAALNLLGTAFVRLQSRVGATATSLRTMSTEMSASRLASVGLSAGLAIVSIGIGIWAQRQAEAKAKVQAHSDAVHTLADALRDNNGVVTDTIRLQTAQRLEQDGLLTTAQHLGIATGTYTSAVLGNKTAIDQVKDAVRQYVNTSNEDLFTKKRNYDAILGQIGLYDEAVSANQRVTTATQNTTIATNNNTTATKNSSTALAEEKKKAEELRAALENLVNVNLDAQSAHLQFQAAILTLDGSLKGLDATTKRDTLSLNGNTVAGNQARQTLVANAKAAIADYDAQIKRGVGTGKATQTLNQDITALKAHYHQLGFNDAEVNKIIGSLVALGKQHPNPKVTIQSAAAKKTISDIQRGLQSLRDHVVTITGRYVTDTTLFHPPPGSPALAGLNASGGYIDGPGPKGVDSLLYGLAPGEFVVNADAVAKPGVREFLNRLNTGGRGGAPAGFVQSAQPARGTVAALADRTRSVGWDGPQVVVQPGAVQLAFTGGTWDHASKADVEAIVERGFRDLLNKIQHGGTRR